MNSLTGKVVYTTGKLDYTNATNPKVLPEGNYTILDTKYKWMHGNLTILPNHNPIGYNIVGGFYSPTSKVTNNKDNDGEVHPGWLGYYKEEFPKNGFHILSIFNFHYAICNYRPEGYWPDQKASDHTLIVYATRQPIKQVFPNLLH